VEEKNIKLVLSYDGSNYHGWQRQKNAMTVQEMMEERIRMMVGEPVTLTGSGRTDAGVHAKCQVCNFRTRSGIPPRDMKKGLNSLLPEDIYIREASYVPPEFHARYSARSKTYEYRILNRREPDVFLRNYVWHIQRPLDHHAMAEAFGLLAGTHDFSSFRSSGSGNLNPVRLVTRAELHVPEAGFLCVVMEADGFLRHMVRNVVGTLVEVGLGKMSPARFGEVFVSKDRRLAGIKAPAQGLFLVDVKYPEIP